MTIVVQLIRIPPSQIQRGSIYIQPISIEPIRAGPCLNSIIVDCESFGRRFVHKTQAVPVVDWVGRKGKIKANPFRVIPNVVSGKIQTSAIFKQNKHKPWMVETFEQTH